MSPHWQPLIIAMSDLTKVKISRILFNSQFWMAIIILYLQSRALTLESIFLLITLYYLFTTLLEYPTGVIGDFYSHKLSTLLGYLFLGISMCLLSLPGNFLFYAGVLFTTGLGMSLVSGSDQAYFYALTKHTHQDFQHELSQNNSVSLIWVVITISLGGLIGKYHLQLPIFLNGIAFLLSACFLFLSKFNSSPMKKTQANIFAQAFEGITFLTKDTKILYIILISSLIGTFFIGFKWIYNLLFQAASIDVRWWGILISLATIFTAIGTRLTSIIKSINLNLIIMCLFVSIFVTGLTQISILSIVGLIFMSLFRGYLETNFDIILNLQTSLSIRARILSFKSLLIRLGAVPFMLFSGYILEKISVQFLLTSLVIIMLSLYCESP